MAASGIKGDNPNGGMLGAAVGTVVGYGFGSVVENYLSKVFNPWYRSQWKDLGFGISSAVPKSPIPSLLGGGVSAFGQEVTGNSINIIKSGK